VGLDEFVPKSIVPTILIVLPGIKEIFFPSKRDAVDSIS